MYVEYIVYSHRHYHHASNDQQETNINPSALPKPEFYPAKENRRYLLI
jgi:hypothetical protein